MACLLLLCRARQPLSLSPELFSLLHPVFFWLANTLELYHFISRCFPGALQLHLAPGEGSGGGGEGEGGGEEEEEEEDPLTTLFSVMVYCFQQSFYPVSKVRDTD